MALNFGDREVMKIKITYKNFRNEPSEKLSFKLHCPVNSLLKKDISIFNIKTSFPFKTVCLYLKLKKKQALAKSFVNLNLFLFFVFAKPVSFSLYFCLYFWEANFSKSVSSSSFCVLCLSCLF